MGVPAVRDTAFFLEISGPEAGPLCPDIRGCLGFRALQMQFRLLITEFIEEDSPFRLTRARVV